VKTSGFYVFYIYPKKTPKVLTLGVSNQLRVAGWVLSF